MTLDAMPLAHRAERERRRDVARCVRWERREKREAKRERERLKWPLKVS